MQNIQTHKPYLYDYMYTPKSQAVLFFVSWCNDANKYLVTLLLSLAKLNQKEKETLWKDGIFQFNHKESQ